MLRHVRYALAGSLLLGGLLTTTTAHAEDGDDDSERSEAVKFGRAGKGFGIGVSLGDPLGLSLKYFLRPQHALSFHAAWGVLHHGDGLATIDYHWHTPVIGDSAVVDTRVYIGLGVGVAFWAKPGPSKLQAHDQTSPSGAALMLRVPAAGIAYHWTGAPVDTAIELAWSPYVVRPDLRHLDASIKIRYFF
jgi:hypothetical protein